MAEKHRAQLDRLVLFAAVAEAGGFTAAAARLGTSKTVLSQQVSRLEAELGTSLFARTTRRVALTEAGQQLFDDCGPLLRDLTGKLEHFADAREEPTGTLRITTSADYAQSVLGSALGEFMRIHSRLRVELVASSEVLDLVKERVDLAIRLGWLRESSLRATRLGGFEQVVVAAPSYLARAGTPKQPEDLAEQRWVELTLLRHSLRWRFSGAGGQQREVRAVAQARANSPEAVLGLVRGGVGISVCADFAVADDLQAGRLQRLLPQWSLPSGGIYAVYPGARQVPAKVRRFVDFFRGYLQRG